MVSVFAHTSSNTQQNVGRVIILILCKTCETKDQAEKKIEQYKYPKFETQYVGSPIKINNKLCTFNDNRFTYYITAVTR